MKDVLALKRQWDQSPGISARAVRAARRPVRGGDGAHRQPCTARRSPAPNSTRSRTGSGSSSSARRSRDSPARRRWPENLSPAAILATQWREALAANTIGGRVDDEARWRNAAEEIKKAQTGWRRVGPVPEAVGRELDERFQRACQRFFKQRDQRRKPLPARRAEARGVDGQGPCAA